MRANRSKAGTKAPTTFGMKHRNDSRSDASNHRGVRKGGEARRERIQSFPIGSHCGGWSFEHKGSLDSKDSSSRECRGNGVRAAVKRDLLGSATIPSPTSSSVKHPITSQVDRWKRSQPRKSSFAFPPGKPNDLARICRNDGYLAEPYNLSI
uniref:Uncharacterized protein n=1 Tax=Vespula pensylvanica TaxID=30213 RepID=A0A834PDC4_VESPE|nr:hypothetical protein H0235_000030 [Vespula pensylvanica]